MNKSLHGLTVWLLSCSAFAQEPERSNTTNTTLEIYAFIAVVFLVGFVWVYFKQKKDKEREVRRRTSRSA